MTLRPVKTVAVAATADGDNTVIAALTNGRQIQVVSYALTISGTGGTLIMRDLTANTTRATFVFPASGGTLVFAGSEDGPAFTCGQNEGLEFNNTAAQDVNGHLSYVEV